MNVTRERALCICYQLSYNEENIAKAKKKLDEMNDEYDVCYLTDPTVPVFAPKSRIYAKGSGFRTYIFRDADSFATAATGVTQT
jgi:hypothetical protein